MGKVIFSTPSNKKIIVEATIGDCIMLAATANDIEGIDAECGGGCSCATCHVHVADHWLDKVGPPSDMERQMLEFEEELTDRSRLCCQITMSDELDGIELQVVGR